MHALVLVVSLAAPGSLSMQDNVWDSGAVGNAAPVNITLKQNVIAQDGTGASDAKDVRKNMTQSASVARLRSIQFIINVRAAESIEILRRTQVQGARVETKEEAVLSGPFDGDYSNAGQRRECLEITPKVLGRQREERNICLIFAATSLNDIG